MTEAITHESVAFWLGSGFVAVLLMYSAYNLKRAAMLLDNHGKRLSKLEKWRVAMDTERAMVRDGWGRRVYDPSSPVIMEKETADGDC